MRVQGVKDSLLVLVAVVVGVLHKTAVQSVVR